ncbi:MAG: TrmH family RNA methyltransferase [Cyclobacteriaceae bacterium]
MISKATLKSIKALKLKKYRTKEQKFLVEGIKSVNELIHEKWDIEVIIATKKSIDFLSDISKIEVVSKELLESLTQLSTNEDCLAVARMPKKEKTAVDIRHHIIALDGIQDPGNLGTIIRTLDWFGFNQIVCSKDTVDFYNPKTINASMGSFTRVYPHYLELPLFLSQSQLPVFGLDMAGTDSRFLNFDRPAIFVLGNESNGIRSELRGQIDNYLSIAGKGNVESLNIGITAGILIYQLAEI